jgi:SAM-dependent methyltransferase
VYSTKAHKYAQYRWDYAPQAIRAILDVTQLARESTIADIGAGTGILTRHLAGKVTCVYAVEPNPEMRRMAQVELQQYSSVKVLDGRAEATALPGGSIDLIVVAQAIHWFDPQPTRREFRRILKPDGWLALLRNYGTDEALGQELAALSVSENGVQARPGARPPERKPVSYYYGDADFERRVYPFTLQEPWEAFIGSLCSASYMPDEDHPLYPNLERAARRVFDRLSSDGVLAVHGATELYLGQIKAA